MDLEELKSIAAACKLCNLSSGRNRAVFDKGNVNAKIMICGMAPADEENKVGLPFVGRSGHLLDDILNDVGFDLSKVYITNLVKCYLPAGELLKQEWVDACLPYLIAQIDMVKPKVILTLGKDATMSLLGFKPSVSLFSIRKTKFYDYVGDMKIIPTYHPSFLLRGGGVKHKNYKDVVNDFMLANKISVE